MLGEQNAKPSDFFLMRSTWSLRLPFLRSLSRAEAQQPALADVRLAPTPRSPPRVRISGAVFYLLIAYVRRRTPISLTRRPLASNNRRDLASILLPL